MYLICKTRPHAGNVMLISFICIYSNLEVGASLGVFLIFCRLLMHATGLRCYIKLSSFNLFP